MSALKELAESVLRDASTATERPWRIKHDSIYDANKQLVCNMADLYPVNGNRKLIVTSANSAERLAKAALVMMETLTEVESYLHWNADNLSGDDLVGDGRLTMRFKQVTSNVAKALSKANEICRGEV